MLQTNDLILLLTKLQENGEEEASKWIRRIIGKPVSLEAIKFINDRRPLDVTQFYERVRNNYNNKKSNLYKNIVKDLEDGEEILTTLHVFLLQVFLYSRQLSEENKLMFFKHTRAEEISEVLTQYYSDFNISPAFQLLRLIKADLCAFETVSGRR